LFCFGDHGRYCEHPQGDRAEPGMRLEVTLQRLNLRFSSMAEISPVSIPRTRAGKINEQRFFYSSEEFVGELGLG
jgi:hypothetical protein